MKLNRNIMIKTLFLFVIFFALAFSVSADLQLTEKTAISNEIDGGSFGEGYFTVTNGEATELTDISFSIGDGFASSVKTTANKVTNIKYYIDNTEVTKIATLAASESKDVKFKITVPTDAYAGAYSGQITATSSGTSPLTDSDNFAFNVKTNEQISVSNIVLDGLVIGRESFDVFTVSNVGNKDITASVQAPTSKRLYTTGNNALNIETMSFTVDDLTLFDVPYKSSVTVKAKMTVPADQAAAVYKNNANEKAKITFGSPSQTKEVGLEAKVIQPRKQLDLINELKFGSSGQKRRENLTSTFSVTNTGDETITEISIESNAGSQYNVLFKQDGDDDSTFASKLEDYSLIPGESVSFNMKIHVPKDQHSGERDIGDVIVKSKEAPEKRINSLLLETKSRLIIDEINVNYDSPDNTGEDDPVGDGSSFGGVLPGTELVFTVDLVSDFSSSDNYEKNIDIKRIDVDITIKDIDDNDDIDESDSISILEPGEDDSVDIKFSIPREVDEKDDGYTVEIIVKGEDDDDAEHKITWEAFLDIEKPDHLIEITEARFLDAEVEQGETAKLSFEVQNLGRDAEEDAAVGIECNELGVSKIYSHDDVPKLRTRVKRDSSKFDDIFQFTVDDDQKPGTYTCKIKSYYEKDDESEYKEIDLIVKAKGAEGSSSGFSSEGEGEGEAEGEGESEGEAEGEGEQGGQVIIGDQSFTDSTGYVVLLVIVAVLLLAIFGLLIFKFFK